MVQRLNENLRACSWLAAFLLNKLFLAISMSFYLLKCYSEALLNYKTLIELRSKSSTIIFISKLQLKDRKPDVLVHGLGLVNIWFFFYCSFSKLLLGREILKLSGLGQELKNTYITSLYPEPEKGG